MSNVIKLADKTEDSRHWSPSDMLRDCLLEIEAGVRNGRKAAALFWDDAGEKDHLSYMQAGMTIMEFISLLEAVKAKLIKDEL